MKVFKYLWILVGVLILLVGYFWFCFVVGFSSTYPPLEKYYFNVAQDEIVQRLEKLDSTRNFQVIITDTTGQYPQDYNVYFKISDNKNCAYHLKFRKDKSFINGKRTEISLLGVFDRNKNVGGYRKSDSEYITSLIDKFEKEILPSLNN